MRSQRYSYVHPQSTEMSRHIGCNRQKTLSALTMKTFALFLFYFFLYKLHHYSHQFTRFFCGYKRNVIYSNLFINFWLLKMDLCTVTCITFFLRNPRVATQNTSFVATTQRAKFCNIPQKQISTHTTLISSYVERCRFLVFI